MAKLQNVIRGYTNKYDVEKICVMKGHTIHYDGNLNGFINPEPLMANYQRELINKDVEYSTCDWRYDSYKIYIWMQEENNEKEEK